MSGWPGYVRPASKWLAYFL